MKKAQPSRPPAPPEGSSTGKTRHLPWKLLFGWGLLLGLGGQACTAPPPLSKEEVIAEKLREKVAAWETASYRKCRERVLEAASQRVDSILIATARSTKDTLPKPLKPPPPQPPPLPLPFDSLRPEPLLRDSG